LKQIKFLNLFELGLNQNKTTAAPHSGLGPTRQPPRAPPLSPAQATALRRPPPASPACVVPAPDPTPPHHIAPGGHPPFLLPCGNAEPPPLPPPASIKGHRAHPFRTTLFSPEEHYRSPLSLASVSFVCSSAGARHRVSRNRPNHRR
jgi:hypothetical protein